MDSLSSLHNFPLSSTRGVKRPSNGMLISQENRHTAASELEEANCMASAADKFTAKTMMKS